MRADCTKRSRSFTDLRPLRFSGFIILSKTVELIETSLHIEP